MSKPIQDHGTITYIPISGGFWGIITTEGKRLRPVDELNSDMLIDGTSVSFTYLPSDQPNIYMWGKGIQILNITPLRS